MLVLHHPGCLRHLPRRQERPRLRHRGGAPQGEALSEALPAGAAARAGRAARAGVLAALGATLAWGTNYSVAKRVLREIDPLSIASARAAAGILVFGGALLWLDGPSGLSWTRLRRTWVLGLLGVFANQILFIEGLTRTSAAHSAILIALLPVHVLLLSALARMERVGPYKILGVLVAFCGVVLVAAENGIDLRSEYLRGDLLTLLGGLSFAAYTVAGKPVLKELGALRTTAYAFLSGGAGILLVGLPAARRQDWRAVSPAAFAGLAFVLLGATILAYFLYYFAVERIEPSKAAVFTYLQPVVAGAVAYVAAGEAITPRLLGGGALVLLGVILAERAR